MKAYKLIIIINLIVISVGYLGLKGVSSNRLLPFGLALFLLNIAILISILIQKKKVGTLDLIRRLFSTAKIKNLVVLPLLAAFVTFTSVFFLFFYEDNIIIHVSAENICDISAQILNDLNNIEDVNNVTVTSYSPDRLLYKVDIRILNNLGISKQKLNQVILSKDSIEVSTEENDSEIVYYFDFKSCQNSQLNDFVNLTIIGSNNKTFKLPQLGSLHFQRSIKEQLVLNGRHAIAIEVSTSNPFYYLKVRKYIFCIMEQLILGEPSRLIAFRLI